MKTSRTHTAITERGTVINMTVTCERDYIQVNETSFCDGDNVEITRGKEIKTNKIVLTINGKEYEGYFGSEQFSESIKKGCYGVFLAGNQPIGLSEAKYKELTAIVDEAKKEAETDANWMAYKAKCAENIKCQKEYDQHVKNVNKMMNN